MTRLRLPLLVVALLPLAGQAQAQNFFERLFGLVPDRPSAPQHQAPPAEAPPAERLPPPQARPVALRAPSEELVIGRELKQNGSTGLLKIERTARADLRARLTLAGRRSAQSAEACQITIGGANGASLTSQGHPDGVERFTLEDPSVACPLQVDILDEAVLVKPKGESCLIQTSTCQADPTGMWGPEAAQLIPKASIYEAARGVADKAVRDNYKVLVQRARPEAVRPLVAEQASFSSEREVLCRTYAKEGSHSFCNARFSEARAISLAHRLGVTYASAAAEMPAGPSQAEYRGRRRNDPYALPSTDEISRRPFQE